MLYCSLLDKGHGLEGRGMAQMLCAILPKNFCTKNLISPPIGEILTKVSKDAPNSTFNTQPPFSSIMCYMSPRSIMSGSSGCNKNRISLLHITQYHHRNDPSGNDQTQLNHGCRLCPVRSCCIFFMHIFTSVQAEHMLHRKKMFNKPRN